MSTAKRAASGWLIGLVVAYLGNSAAGVHSTEVNLLIAFLCGSIFAALGVLMGRTA